MALANIEYVKPGHPGGGPVLPGGPVDPGYGVDVGGKPVQPLPPLPGIWPPPGQPSLPIELPPVEVSPPIYIPETPEHPIAKPPGTIWPPLPPDLGLDGKVAILVWVMGVGRRWYIYDAGAHPDQGLPGSPGHPDQGLPHPPARPDAGLPPTAQPKLGR
jgi:hypothetical protein